MTVGKRLRILFLADARSVHTKRWVGWFAARHEVLLVHVAAEANEGWDRADIPLAGGVPRYRWPGVSLVRIVVHLKRLIRRFRPDIVHAHYLVPNAWMAAVSGFPRVVTTTWGSDLLLARGVAERMNRWSLRRARLNTADSRDAVERLAEVMGSTERVRLVQFGVDTAVFAAAAASGDLRRSWGIPANARILVSPRILRSLYNGQTIARAFIEVAPRYPDLYLVFLAYNADPDYQQSVERELRDAGLSDRARFVPSVPHASMPELYRDATAVVSVPSSDTTPVTLLEAMSCGTLVISSDLPSIREWVEPGVSGWLVRAGDPADLARSIHALLEITPADRAAMARVNREIVAERASHQREMERVEQMLLALAEGRELPR